MGNGMTKEEAMRFQKVEDVAFDTHEMVNDLHRSLHQNGFLEKVRKNTEFRESHTEEIKERKNFWLVFNRTIATGTALLIIGALLRYIITGSFF